MATLTVRNVPDEVHRALRVRAAERGHSAEAELRDILHDTLIGEAPVRLGTLLGDIAREAGLTDEEAALFDQIRDKTPAEPVSFE